MAEARVRVQVEGAGEWQHLATPPDDDTAHAWDGETVCGSTGQLRWVTPENVDVGKACPDCAAREGFAPPLEGDYPGPV